MNVTAHLLILIKILSNLCLVDSLKNESDLELEPSTSQEEDIIIDSNISFVKTVGIMFC